MTAQSDLNYDERQPASDQLLWYIAFGDAWGR